MSLRRILWSPTLLLALTAGLLALVVQSGELGSADTQHRMQAAHALWISEPPVFPEEYPEFGLKGRHGELETWYGIGQSLEALPMDIAGTWLARLPVFVQYGGTDPSVRNIVISVSMNLLLEVLTAMVCFDLLGRLGFSTRESVAGMLALLFATTHLHYTQNMMENNSIFLLTLAGLRCHLAWIRTGSRRTLLLGAGALGLNLLTRLTTGLDLIACGLFALLVLWLEGVDGTKIVRRAKGYLATTLPVYATFGLVDRIYQYQRFGSFFNTYVSIFGQQARLRDPSLPLKYPFEKPFHEGFFGPLLQPEKSIFLFDPLLILTILIVAVSWRRFSPAVKAYTLASMALLLAYICFYAKYTVWSGDFAWGDRYVETAVQFAALLAVPLLLRFSMALSRPLRVAGWSLVAASVVVQATSIAFWCPLEIYQMQTLGHPTFVIALRIKNIITLALRQPGDWGLIQPVQQEDAWDYAHITTWNLLPCLLRRVGVAPMWVVRLAEAVWTAALAALAATLWQLRRAVMRYSDACDAQ